jgi:hypothetical protein
MIAGSAWLVDQPLEPQAASHTADAVAAALMGSEQRGLLDRASDVGEYRVRVGADEPNRTYNDYQNHSQHYRVLGDILTCILRPESTEQFPHDPLLPINLNDTTF